MKNNLFLALNLLVLATTSQAMFNVRTRAGNRLNQAVPYATLGVGILAGIYQGYFNNDYDPIAKSVEYLLSSDRFSRATGIITFNEASRIVYHCLSPLALLAGKVISDSAINSNKENVLTELLTKELVSVLEANKNTLAKFSHRHIHAYYDDIHKKFVATAIFFYRNKLKAKNTRKMLQDTLQHLTIKDKVCNERTNPGSELTITLTKSANSLLNLNLAGNDNLFVQTSDYTKYLSYALRIGAIAAAGYLGTKTLLNLYNTSSLYFNDQQLSLALVDNYLKDLSFRTIKHLIKS